MSHPTPAPLFVHTLVLGSGAAGLNAALQLHRRGIDDVLLLTESLDGGTSINTGSDKQTYYKLGLYGDEADSPGDLAATLFAGGSVDGDIALTEAALSARAFYNLLELGVPFPQDAFGQFPGYKTDHDPRQRASSIGPYTSREMCRKLIDELRRIDCPIRENRIAVRLIVLSGATETTVSTPMERRIAGVICIDTDKPLDSCLEVYLCENLVFATGGPGGLYQRSVYPAVHLGGIGLALEVGITAQNLSESQFGLASVPFRWNVSGTYMQVLPRLISTAEDGRSESREFLEGHFDSREAMLEAVFLKGYHWPFDVRKIAGSSLIDLLVHRETVERGRRVFLDYRTNTPELDFAALPEVVRDYLGKSNALFGTPFERLCRMNPLAAELYKNHDIDLAIEPLEIALCVQHNNGGLAVNRWWESVNTRHFFAVGETAGTHGLARPGGSALNAGQVGGFRIAEFVAAKYRDWTLDRAAAAAAAVRATAALGGRFSANWPTERSALQKRMSDFGAAIVSQAGLDQVVQEAWDQYRDCLQGRETAPSVGDWAESLRTDVLCLAHAVYLESIATSVRSGVGSRGSRLIIDPRGEPISGKLPDDWRFVPEDETFRERILETNYLSGEGTRHSFRPRRPIPKSEAWFETAWAAFREGKIFEQD